MDWREFIVKVETDYAVAIPDLYKRLAADGMLDWGLPGGNWYEETFPGLLAHPPLLLVGAEFELPNPDALWELNETPNQSEELPRLKPEFRNKAVIFAEAGNGDYYAFDYTRAGEPCVVRLYHDDYASMVEAENLADFIFRRLLRAQADYFAEDGLTPEVYRARLPSQLESHRPYLSAEQYGFLRETYGRPFRKDKWGGLFILDDAEAEAAERRFIACGRLDEEFEAFDFD